MIDAELFVMLIEQDRGLEELSKIIGRQRQMAQAIGEEVESQNGTINLFYIFSPL